MDLDRTEAAKNTVAIAIITLSTKTRIVESLKAASKRFHNWDNVEIIKNIVEGRWVAIETIVMISNHERDSITHIMTITNPDKVVTTAQVNELILIYAVVANLNQMLAPPPSARTTKE